MLKITTMCPTVPLCLIIIFLLGYLDFEKGRFWPSSDHIAWFYIFLFSGFPVFRFNLGACNSLGWIMRISGKNCVESHVVVPTTWLFDPNNSMQDLFLSLLPNRMNHVAVSKTYCCLFGGWQWLNNELLFVIPLQMCVKQTAASSNRESSRLFYPNLQAIKEIPSST